MKQREQDRARPGAEIGDAQAPRAIGNKRQCKLDDRFGFRAGDQNGGCDGERQAPEFARADDARDRLAGKTARFEGRDRCGILGQRARRRRHEAGMVEAERMANENARVEIGRLEPGIAERRGEAAAGLLDSHSRRDCGHAPSAASSSA